MSPLLGPRDSAYSSATQALSIRTHTILARFYLMIIIIYHEYFDTSCICINVINTFLKGLVDYFKAQEACIVRSAFDYQGNPDVRLMYGSNPGGGAGATQEQIVQKGTQKVQKLQEKGKTEKGPQKEQKRQEKKVDMTPEQIVEQAQKRAAQKEEERKAQDAVREKELHKQIDRFYEDPEKQTMDFPKTLNSWERQVVHAYCEILKLKHESKGEGMNRFITVSKCSHAQRIQPQEAPKPAVVAQQPPQEALSQPLEEQKQQQAPPQKPLTMKEKLQEYANKRKQMEEEKKQAAVQPQQEREEKKQKPKKEKKPVKDNPVMRAAEELDDLDFLDAMIYENKKCSHIQCQTNIELFFCLCKVCKKRFCALHFHEAKHDCEGDVIPQQQQQKSQGGAGYLKEASQSSRDKAKAAIKEMEQKRLAKQPQKKEGGSKK